MKAEHWIAAALVFLALFVAFSAVYVGGALTADNPAGAQSANEDMLSFEQAAAFLNVTVDELMEMTDQSQGLGEGGIPFVKISGRMRFSKIALTEWFARATQDRQSY